MLTYQWFVCLLLFCFVFKVDVESRVRYFPKTVCWSLFSSSYRQTLCLCLLCARLLCILISRWLWLMPNTGRKSKGGMIEGSQKYYFLPLSLPGSDLSQLHSCILGAPAQWSLSQSHRSCSCPFRHREVSHCGWFPELHIPFWLLYGWLFLCKQSFSLNALQLSPLFPAITLINDKVVRKTVCTQMYLLSESNFLTMYF